MLRRLYDKIIELAATPYAFVVLGAVSFAESSFFPIPPDVVLVPMVLANPAKARLYAAWCTVTSVAGGLVGYAIGALLWDTLGAWLISAYGYGDSFDTFREAYAEWGAWIILIKGLTPIPYKLVTIASGFAGYDIWAFIVLSFITRGARFFIVAELLRYFGEPIREFIEKRLTLVTTVFLVAVAGGVILARYAF
ncbi:SNARE associated Golgi protein [Methyloligella halotolerans]|uniref:SNARE associated Golgi protein n=1 Tax=Methyloligella halotolerans TaxID=1177755 RepID=A0A1E2RVH4_9HYPH|nr:YqaA family protein [Methyloligella halotolerans]ODA66098.1 SNARE associated Golgi protein [Methyloligella halotolerans]